ncbi:MAG: hypothetical protein CMJ58_09345 [Planctomycetaceae bacterium]|nr:hypothetical protein [Planctomycetaceae bacterium]
MRCGTWVAATWACVVLQIAAVASETPSASRPNFVVIMVDDLGYSDFGCYGGEIETPNIDALASGGVRFREFYNCSRCCQTRASLLTGYYPQRVGMDEFGKTMDLAVPTVAQRLKDVGYRTAMSGKWHLSELPGQPQGQQRLRWMNHEQRLRIPFADPASYPTQRGFDEFYGVIWGVVNHFDPFSLCEGERAVRRVPKDYYATDAITEHAIGCIRDAASNDAPLFLYVAYTAPHWPLHAPEDAIAKYRGRYDEGWEALRQERFARQVKQGVFAAETPVGPVINNGPAWDRLPQQRRDYLAEKMAVHAAMVDCVDQGVGEIIEALRQSGQLENTLVLVLSDNGASPEIPGGPGYDRYSATRDGWPALREAELQLPENRGKLGTQESYAGIGSQWASAANTPLRYWKMESYDGGCRTPLIAHWPAGLKLDAGGFESQVGHVMDIAPTLLELAGVADVDGLNLDGSSLVSVLRGETDAPRQDRTLFFSHGPGRGVREGSWKASKLANRGWELFDLAKDPGETSDVSGEHPDVLNGLVRKMFDWRRTAEVRTVSADEQVAAPAVPLVACDPYFSIWSPGTTLTDNDTIHWTGAPHRLTSLISVDGEVYRLMGKEPAEAPALRQTGLELTATQTKYSFAGAGVKLSLVFTTPALPDDVDTLSRPITYLTYGCQSADGETHDVRIYFEASGEIAVNEERQRVSGRVSPTDGMAGAVIGSVDQQVLGKSGDDLRIDWGYLHVATPMSSGATVAIGGGAGFRESFASDAALDQANTDSSPQPAAQVSAAVTLDLEEVGGEAAERWIVLAYDDLESIEFMHRRLQPYWRRDGKDAEDLLAEAMRDRLQLMQRCDAFDRELRADLVNVGGEKYAAIATLAYRQCFAAGKFVADANGQPIQFCKENNSNGCIGTSDVFYPMAPQFLLFGSSLAKSFVVPFMEYAESDRWKFPFAPHDLGTYPHANGQVYGGGETSAENQMPVEECGNLLLLMGAIAKIDGNADFAERYWPTLQQWAEYLKDKGFDPENQLCTDDFAGHLAHNVNLSAKAICALGAFAQLCEMRGDEAKAAEYRGVAEQYAEQWISAADDGDHFRLAFDKPGTWSQKYNLVWDEILGLKLFPRSVLTKEMAYYRRMQNRFGLPLDNRRAYTKLDWVLWTATLTGDRDDFQALVDPVYNFLLSTPNRVPMTDWYQTQSARRVGFKARPVVGGVFLRMLYDDELWRKWASRDQTRASGYADLPQPPQIVVLTPAADSSGDQAVEWRYTFEQPEDGWQQPDYDDSTWQLGPAGFGTETTPGAIVGTKWSTPAIWLRRSFDLQGEAAGDVRLHIHHDEDAEVYLNGTLLRDFSGFTTRYRDVQLSNETVKLLKPTGNVLAIVCRQTSGGQYIDAGFTKVEPVE